MKWAPFSVFEKILIESKFSLVFENSLDSSTNINLTAEESKHLSLGGEKKKENS